MRQWVIRSHETEIKKIENDSTKLISKENYKEKRISVQSK